MILASACALVDCTSTSRGGNDDAAKTSLPTSDARARLASLRTRFGDALSHGDVRLVSHEGRMHAQVDKRGLDKPATVTLPTHANGQVTVEDDRSGLAIAFALRGAERQPIVIEDGVGLYAKAFANADMIHRVSAEGTEDFVAFDARPDVERLEYDVDVSHVAGLRLVGNTLEFLDTFGTPRLRVAPPYVIDAKGVRHDALLSIEGCAHDRDPRAPWGRLVTAPGAERCRVRVAWEPIEYPALVDPGWFATGWMVVGRQLHTASLLSSGKVLLAGGRVSTSIVSLAELYDPNTRTFSSTGPLSSARSQHSASVLSSGKVLVAGGDPAGSLAELYDPAAGTFSPTGSMVTARRGQAATVLGSGDVLIAGGVLLGWTSISLSELYDRTSGTFASVGAMTTAHLGHTATLLGSGKVLVVGGGGPGQSVAELYDPSSKTFTATGHLLTGRQSHTASLLPSGEVLVAGGQASTTTYAVAEVYDPVTGTFDSVVNPMVSARASHQAVTLPSGRVLLAGGESPLGILSVAELFDPATNTFITAEAMTRPRTDFTAVLLPSGGVLAAGGSGPSPSSAEVYALANGDWCTSNDACGSQLCVDGVCCNSACAGPCDACNVAGALGTCKPVVAGTSSAACAPLLCAGSAGCPTSCASDAGCVSTHYCAADGTCKARKAQGTACPATECKTSPCRQCASSFCVDGVCCDSACTGCRACSAALKGGGVDGTCGDVPADTDPKNACSPDPGYPSSCGADGMCDGAGKCRSFAKPGTACGSTACTGGIVAGKICPGGGAPCKDTSVACAPYTCGVDSCKTSCATDSDCDATAFCSTAKTCTPRDLGAACSSDAACASGHCVDGVCCNSACTGQCESCSASGSVGSCVAIVGAPRGGRSACDALDATACDKHACDGLSRDRCDGWANDTSTPCGADACTADKQLEKAGRCDGNGKCALPPQQSCTPYICQSAKCATRCASDTECAKGFTCSAGGTCIQGAICNADHSASVDTDGKETRCAPYRCGADGKCATACSDSDQCAVGVLCHRPSRVCVTIAASEDEGGCVYGAGAPRTYAWIGALIASAALACMRRSARVRTPHRGRPTCHDG